MYPGTYPASYGSYDSAIVLVPSPGSLSFLPNLSSDHLKLDIVYWTLPSIAGLKLTGPAAAKLF
jgi:hypothetical protein